jgi:two-component system sensor histidine kinase ChvG
MKLRKQLALLSLLSLSLPWAGCQYVKEVSSALQHGQLAALDATANAVAARLAAEPALFGRDRGRNNIPTLYAHNVEQPLIVDGYIDDWRGLKLPSQKFSAAGHSPSQFSGSIRAAKFLDQLYLFVDVQTPLIDYHHPGSGQLASGDHLLLSRGYADGSSIDYTLATSAPGSLLAHYRDVQGQALRENHIEGVWHEQEHGYTVELQLPLAFSTYGFGLQIVGGNGNSNRRMGTHHSQYSAATLTYNLAPIEKALQVFQRPSLQLEVINPEHWSLARAGSLQDNNTAVSGEQPSWLTLQVYRLALAQSNETLPPKNLLGRVEGDDIDLAISGSSNHLWYPSATGQIGRSNVAIIHDQQLLGVLIAEQSSEHLLKLTGNAFLRLIQYSFITTMLVSLTLLFYASWLSWRIRRLGYAAAMAVADDGQLLQRQDHWPSFKAADEIGDLSRNYHELLQRLEGHTHYLKTLASKLSHELRTPLAVVRSSLDNLEHEPLNDKACTFLLRARNGSERLSKLISAMSAASRVESSIQSAGREVFDLAELLRQLIAAYGDIYPQPLQLDIAPADYALNGAPELLVQLLDKLSDNASDFCPPEGNIEYRLQRRGDNILLSISNDGPLLPDKMREQLFDSLVSVRGNITYHNKNSASSPHMGLGLHIVRLIALFHGGRVQAQNRQDESGVIFCIELPAQRTK